MSRRQIPHAEKGMVCPLHKLDMSEVCHACPWWTQLRGKHPVDGTDVDEWGCAVTFMPILLIETSKEARAGADATLSFRNEMVAAARRSDAARTTSEVANQADEMARRITLVNGA